MPGVVAVESGASPVDDLPQVVVPAPDLDSVRSEDEVREQEGLAPRFAIPTPVMIRPEFFGVWDVEGDSSIWRVRITSPGALSLNLGFSGYHMPPGGELRLFAADGSYALPPFTATHNAEHGQLWTAVVLSDDIVVEAAVPTAVRELLVLELSSINVGYRGFGEPRGDRAGACNIDVVCPEAAGWWNEIPAIGVISTGGSTFCTGFMVNNTAGDRAPYFMTAKHCGITSSNAASLVVYWNFQSPTCGQHGGGSLTQYNTGSTWKAAYTASDFTLVRLNQSPNADWGITFAGWDRRDVNATSIVGIHHPNTDEKSISFSEFDTAVTSYLGNSSPGDGTHLKVLWESNPNRGVTEPGSSGSPIFDQNHRILGQLHGGYSACGASDMRDWYGRIFKSWTGGGASNSRLSDWLDPGNTGAQYVDTLTPAGLQVTPSYGLDSQGDRGGPFTPGSLDYTLKNVDATPLNYTVSKTQPWVSLSGTSGTLAPNATVVITVSINAGANSLPQGVYSDTVSFVNTTNHQGDTTRGVTLRVGIPHVVYAWNMDANPGWSVQGLWAWGTPTGGGGQFGNNDPTAGHTGTKVYGYNLNGDYEDNLPERHLTTAAIDCSALTSVSLRFWRYLNVEQQNYDHAYVRISTNGSAWTTLWQNTSELTDAVWTFQQFDLAAIADQQPTVYLRWTMGTTDGSWQYSGWNVDDVEIWGIQPAAVLLGDLNCDGLVNFDDVNPFVLAISDPAAYAVQYPDCNLMNGDCDGSGQVDFGDINAFVALLGG